MKEYTDFEPYYMIWRRRLSTGSPKALHWGVPAGLLLSTLLLSGCIIGKGPSQFGMSTGHINSRLLPGYHQNTNRFLDGYVQDTNPFVPGYIQRTNPFKDGYVQDQYPFRDGYIQDTSPYMDGYVQDKTVFGFDAD